MEQQRDEGKDFKNGEGGKLGQVVGALKRKGLEPLTNYVDNLWQASWYFRIASGFMQNISKGEYPDQWKIRYLPVIDLNPTKEKCIYSTLIYSRTSEKPKYCYPVLNI